MSDTALITFAPAGDKTLAQFLGAQAKELKDVHHELLNEIARAIAERGWIQPIDAVVNKLVEQDGINRDKLKGAIADLVHRRLLVLDETQTRFAGFLGSISFTPTAYRAHLDNGIDVYTYGGMELLAVNSTLLKRVDVFTRCPITNAELELTIVKEQIVDTNIAGISGFMAEWDGSESLFDVAARSPLFADDAAMEKWVAQNPSIKGTELPGDLLLWVGMEAAKQLGGLRFKLIGHQG